MPHTPNHDPQAPKIIYYCGQCHGTLNPRKRIVLIGHFKNQRGIFLFSAKPGDYSVVIPEGFNLQKGDRIDFFCPICHYSLDSSLGRDLAEIRFRQGDKKGKVDFSKVYGQHATLFMEKGHVQVYGEDDFFIMV